MISIEDLEKLGRIKIKDILKGLRCETCSNGKHFINVSINHRPNYLYVYIDDSGATRCFCKKHMKFLFKDKTLPCYDARLLSDILKELKGYI